MTEFLSSYIVYFLRPPNGVYSERCDRPQSIFVHCGTQKPRTMCTAEINNEHCTLSDLRITQKCYEPINPLERDITRMIRFDLVQQERATTGLSRIVARQIRTVSHQHGLRSRGNQEHWINQTT